jgi:predicted permease
MTTLRFAWRHLCATPRLTAAAVACAALGLGAAIFMTTLVNAVLFSQPALVDADRLVRVWAAAPGSTETSDVSYQDVLELQRRVPSFDTVDAVSRTRLALTTEAGTERLRGESVTPGYFARLGLRPAVGRLFADGEYAPDSDRPVLISYALWQRRFGGRPDITGQPFRTRPTGTDAAGSLRTIIGVLPAGFAGTVDPDVSDFWIPMAHYEPARLVHDRTARATWVIAHLRPGATMDDARREVGALGRALADEYPSAYEHVTLVAEPFGETWRARFRLSLYTLLTATALLLMVACVNIATLLLARLAERAHDLRVRLMLGATRRRLVGELLTESLAIAWLGGAAGLVIAAWAVRAVSAWSLFELPAYVSLTIEPRVVTAGFGLVVLTGLLFGVLPARLGSMAGEDRGAGVRVSLDRRQRRYGRALVAAQVAFTCLLLAGASLLARSYARLVSDDLGYRQDRLLRMAVSPDPSAFTTGASRVALAGEITRAFDSEPGVVQTAVMAGVLPPWFDDTTTVLVAPDAPLRDAGWHAVDAAYFDVMEMRLLDGRLFAPGDRHTDAATAIVSETLARRIHDATGRTAIGQRVRLAPARSHTPAAIDVIGVVNDVEYHGPLRPRPVDADIYVPIERGRATALSIAVVTTGDPGTMIEPLSRVLGRLAPTSPQHWISTMTDELALQYRDARLYSALSLVFGAAAAALAALGIYSALANQVARRQRELAIRLAIGAPRRRIGGMVVVEGAWTVAAGIGIGIAGAALASRLLEGLLFGVAPGDPWSLGLVAAVVGGIGLAASSVPAWRASRVNPVKALRGA